MSKPVASRWIRIFSLVVAAFLAVSLWGCATPGAGTADEQSANRAYMSQVNQILNELSTELNDFDEAVARGDVVAMRTEADQAFKTLQQFHNLDVPSDLATVNDDYEIGIDSLRSALDGYITLYTEIESATEAHPFNYSTLDERIKVIQDLYDEGISHLKSGDETAADL